MRKDEILIQAVYDIGQLFSSPIQTLPPRRAPPLWHALFEDWSWIGSSLHFLPLPSTLDEFAPHGATHVYQH
jgi:hypothetical protein